MNIPLHLIYLHLQQDTQVNYYIHKEVCELTKYHILARSLSESRRHSLSRNTLMVNEASLFDLKVDGTMM